MVGHGRNRNRKPAFRQAALLYRPHFSLEEATPKELAAHRPPSDSRRASPCAAFTLVEVMVGTVVTTMMLVSLYAGFTFGFREMQLVREEARATQILQEKMELVRLLNWDQAANLPGYVPTTFTESFYAADPTNAPSSGTIYTGTVTITNAPITESYKNDLRQVKVSVSWTSGKSKHTRKMSCFVSQYGMQKYVY